MERFEPRILNPRGTSGAGKTELARRIIALYATDGRRAGLRADAFGMVLPHPRGRRPLAVVGHYAATSGGSDRIRASQGGLDAAIAWAAERAGEGCDVLIEGLRLSYEVGLTRRLARAGRLHVLRLATPPERCTRNLVARRRLGRASAETMVPKLAAEAASLHAACARLPPDVLVEELPFDAAMVRAREVLGV